MLHVLIAQKQKGGPLTPEEMQDAKDEAIDTLMPQLLEASGAPAAQPQATDGKGTVE